MGESGDPIGTPNVCLYTLLLNEKYVDERTHSIAFKNSVNGIFILSLICFHRILILLNAKSVGTLIHKETTSNAKKKLKIYKMLSLIVIKCFYKCFLKIYKMLL